MLYHLGRIDGRVKPLCVIPYAAAIDLQSVPAVPNDIPPRIASYMYRNDQHDTR